MMQSVDNFSSSCTVLVVVDDDGAREALTFLLESEGFSVRAYSNPNDVLGQTELPPRSCIVTDYNMPQMNGLELVAELRKRQSSIPAILITGASNLAIRNRAAAAYVPVIEKLYVDKLPRFIQEMMGSAIN